MEIAPTPSLAARLALARVAVRPPPAPVLAPVPPTARERAAAGLVAAGALAVGLVAMPTFAFELDRFFAPKELVLHACALGAVLLLRRAPRRGGWARADALLAAALALGVVSAFLAPNGWLALRALAVSASGVALYGASRALARAGLGRFVAGAVAVAITAVAAGALAQAYGVRSDFFSLNRAPGGTLGNRNAVAHLAAVGLPLVVFGAFRTRAWFVSLLAGPAAGALLAALVLTRSRAGWLALLATALVVGFGMLLRRGRWGRAERGGVGMWGREGVRETGPDAQVAEPPPPTPGGPPEPAVVRGGPPRTRYGLRLALFAVGAAGALAVLLAAPNTLQWRSDSPYLDTARNLVNHREGSGRGRMLQYRRSAQMALDAPLLGVGPGNWPVVYPRYAPRADPSIEGSTGMTANPWPSSDAVALLAERGWPAAGLLAGFAFALGIGALARTRRAETDDEALAALARAGVLTAAVVAGAFDAVLLLAAPAFLVAAALGALAPVTSAPEPASPNGPRRRWAVALVLVAGTLFVAQGAGRVASMALASDGPVLTASPRRLEAASLLDPGGYRVRLRAAERYRQRGDCDGVREHAGAALALFPEAPAPARLLRRCGTPRLR